MNYSSNFIAEKFVQTVVRAFYVDSVVVVIDALIREKYIREEEIGPRLRMSSKQAREVMALLTDVEMLVKLEELPLHVVDSTAPMNSKRIVKFYYIDYQSFVNITRLRIYHMLKSVQSEEKSQVDDIFYECPTCKTKYSSLQAIKQRSADYKFICTSCCPDFDISRAISQPSYRLKEIDNRGKLNDVQKLEKKMKEQLSRTIDHDGILEMLDDLKDVPLSRNKPSTNIHRGVRTSTIKNKDIATEIQQINNERSSSKSTIDIKEKHFNLLSTRFDGTKKEANDHSDEPKTVEDLKVSSDVFDSNDFQQIKRARQSELPDFLHTSGVTGANVVMKEVQALQMQRGIPTAILSSKASDIRETETNSTFVFNRDAGVIMKTIDRDGNVEEANENDEDEDIDWEEEDEA